MEKADTGNYVWCGVREKYTIREKSVRVIGRKKRKTVRENGVINGAVTQGAMCKDRWVQQNECKLFGGPVFEKPAVGLALRKQVVPMSWVERAEA